MLDIMSSNELDTRVKILEATWRLLERNRGQGVRMVDIAKAAGISRQAVYLHFSSRTKLMIATSRYVDEVKGLNERLKQLQRATTGIELLEACVEVWGNYLPEISGLAKALQNTRETDEATAEAWNVNMSCLRDVCREIIEALHRDRSLSSEWTCDEAVEMFWTLISFNNWEHLTAECGWSTPRYIDRMKILLKRTFVEQYGIKQ